MKKSIISLLACASFAFMFMACPGPNTGSVENPEVAANAEAKANLEAAANLVAAKNAEAKANATAAYDAAHGDEARANAEAKANAIAAGTYNDGSSSGASTSVLRVVSDGTANNKISENGRLQFKLTGTSIAANDVWTFKFKITEEDKVTNVTFRGTDGEGDEKYINSAALSTLTALTGDFAGWYEVTCSAATKANSSFGFSFNCAADNLISGDAVVYFADFTKNGTPVAFDTLTAAEYYNIIPVATIVNLSDVQ